MQETVRNSVRESTNADGSFNFILYQGQIPKGAE